jgi:23S rRNA (cytosine1962-C5)-methyltransferase
MQKIILKKSQSDRIKRGHLWVYSNEIDTKLCSLKDVSPGEVITLYSNSKNFLGYGYINPNTLLSIRVLSQHKKQTVSEKLIHNRLKQALSLRETLYPSPYYRLVHGEGDYLPGLVVDRYGDFLVCQINTAGMQQLSSMVFDSLIKLLSPQGILLKSDEKQRTLEGLEEDNKIVYGDIPEETEITTEAGKFIVALQAGQKTGWFYDQTENRKQLKNIVKGKTVLDLFSYTGSFGITAALYGAEQVTCVDSSQSAIDYVNKNAELNGMSDKVETIKSDAFDQAKSFSAEKQRFDIILVDPPAFIKRKKDAKKGVEAYRRINELALRLTNRDGFLSSSSCSFNLPEDNLKNLIQKSGRHVDRRLQLIYQGQQDKDHPVHPAMPETKYLKNLIYRTCLE